MYTHDTGSISTIVPRRMRSVTIEISPSDPPKRSDDNCYDRVIGEQSSQGTVRPLRHDVDHLLQDNHGAPQLQVGRLIDTRSVC